MIILILIIINSDFSAGKMSSYLNNNLNDRLLGGKYSLVTTVIKLLSASIIHYIIKFFKSYFKWLLQEIKSEAITEALVDTSMVTS